MKTSFNKQPVGIFIKKAINIKIYLITILIIAGFISCKKQQPDVYKDPFTSDQLKWVNNIQNPIYKVITKTTDSSGIRIDTITSTTNNRVDYTNNLINDDYTIFYYSGQYRVSIYKEVLNPIYSYWTNISLEISNEYDFGITIDPSYNYKTNLPTDTATVNGIFYNDVYDFANAGYFSASIYKKLYFRKGVGFIYIEKTDGSKAIMLQ